MEDHKHEHEWSSRIAHHGRLEYYSNVNHFNLYINIYLLLSPLLTEQYIYLMLHV